MVDGSSRSEARASWCGGAECGVRSGVEWSGDGPTIEYKYNIRPSIENALRILKCPEKECWCSMQAE